VPSPHTAADRNTSLLCVVEEVVTALESLVEFGQTPGGNDLDGGLKGVERELETDLIVSFACTAMRDSNTSFLLSYFDLRACDDRTSEDVPVERLARAIFNIERIKLTKKVDVLINSITLNSWEAQSLNELPSKILNVACDGSNLQSLCLCGLEVLCL
jgi:hypothetical protein